MPNLAVLFIISVFTLLFGVFSPQIAYAHTQLVSVSPANKSTQQVFPTQIKLAFSDNLLNLADKQVNKLYAHDPEHGDLKVGQIKVNKGEIEVAILEKNPIPGTYTVYYRVISQDGHPVSGVTKFNYLSESTEKTIEVLKPVEWHEIRHWTGHHKWHILETIAALGLILAWAIYRRRNRA